MIRELALQPGQRQILIERPGLLATTAVEEFIRWVSPILNMRRTAASAHNRHGQQIRAGDQIVLLYGAANRDPRAFPDPDTLDVTRAPNRHLAFGAGTHLCLGAHLARRDPRPVRGVAAADAGLGTSLSRRTADHPGHLHPRLRPDPYHLHPEQAVTRSESWSAA